MRQAICIGVLVVGCVSATRAADPNDRSLHQGTWAVTSMIRDGEEADPEVRASITRIVEGDHIVWKRANKSFAGTRFEIDAAKTPHTIDLIPDGGPAQDKRVLGIYRIEGQILTICVADVGQPRPVEFAAKAGSKQTLQSFRRIKP
jgi:uncharacterized protein (TIGR03067 family)